MNFNRWEKTKKKRLKNGLIVALGLSLIIHLSLLPLGIEFKDFLEEKKGEDRPSPRIKLVLREKDRSPLKREKKRQIVTTGKKHQKMPPKETRFFSEHNQQVDRQTKAHKVDSFKEAGAGVKDGAKRQNTLKVKKNKLTSRHFKNNQKPSLSDLSFKKTEVYRYRHNKVKQPLPTKGTKTGKRETAGVASNNDFVEEVPLGDMTALNTKEFKYYGFYFRIKRKLEQFWGHSLQQKAKEIYRSGRQLASDDTRITSLKITLDNKGNVVDIFIKSTSGIRELDAAAVESFNRAGPFPNPPKGMIKNGLAIIEWGFVVKS